MGALLLARAGNLAIPVVMEERPVFALEITSNPVETGASVTDHAFSKPEELTLQIVREQPAETWAALKRIAKARTPITVVTGLDVYRDRFIAEVAPSRTAGSARVFAGSVVLKEVIFAESAAVAVSRRPGRASGNRDTGRAPSTAGGASMPTAEKAGDAKTAVRAAGTVDRGDAVTEVAPTEGTSPEAVRNSSLLKRIAG